MLSKRDRESLYKCAKESTIFTFQHSLKTHESMKLIRAWLNELHRWWVSSQEVAKRLAEERR